MGLFIGGDTSSLRPPTKTTSENLADRVKGELPIGEGIAYDSFGRITSLPSQYAGGSTLTTSYYGNEMVASQSQSGVTNTFQLDSELRQRQRVQMGGSVRIGSPACSRRAPRVFNTCGLGNLAPRAGFAVQEGVGKDCDGPNAHRRGDIVQSNEANIEWLASYGKAAGWQAQMYESDESYVRRIFNIDVPAIGHLPTTSD